MGFDAYRKWLGISSKRRPPTYYDLLGIEPGENDHDVIISAIQQRRAFIRSKKGEGYDGQVRTILGQFDEAASTLLVPEFKNAYDRQLGLHLKRRRTGLRSYIMPAWMETKIVRIYGEGSGIIIDAIGIVSVIALAIALMVLSGLWLKSQPIESESSSELTWLELFAFPKVKEKSKPAPFIPSVPPATTSTLSPLRELTETFRSPTAGMEFILLPSGTFTMGAPKSEQNRQADEIQHEVTLRRQFYLGKYEVTQAEFQQVMGFNPSKFTGAKRLPVENATWFDAVLFCNELSKLDGFQACYQISDIVKDGDSVRSADVVLIEGRAGYRLPMEAEWEYACRAGSTTPFSFGNNISTEQVNFNGRDQDGGKSGTYREKTAEVDAMAANAWGLHQMHGNVWEWCHDLKGDYGSGPVSDPTGPASGSTRVRRGGGWSHIAAHCRSANRGSSMPGAKTLEPLGFRVVLVPPSELKEIPLALANKAQPEPVVEDTKAAESELASNSSASNNLTDKQANELQPEKKPAITNSGTPPSMKAPAQLIRAIDQLVAAEGVTTESPGVAIYVIQPGKFIFIKGYGRANLKTSEPITTKTIFETGSLTKPMTATAVLFLQDQGKLSIDDDVRKFIPELPQYDENRPITLKDLLNQVSGLPDYLQFENVPARNKDFLVNEDYAKAFAKNLKSFPLNFPTGEKFEYNNSNYMLLSLVVARVSGKPFAQFMRDEIFSRAGMADTFVYENPFTVRAASERQPAAIGYRRGKNNQWRPDWGLPPNRYKKQLTVGDGGVWTNLEDMARWDMAWRYAKFLQPATGFSMVLPSKTRDGQTNTYGLGFFIYPNDVGGLLGFGHSGDWGGFRTDFYRYFIADTSTVVLSNREDFDTGAFWYKLNDAITKVPAGR